MFTCAAPMVELGCIHRSLSSTMTFKHTWWFAVCSMLYQLAQPLTMQHPFDEVQDDALSAQA